MKKNRDEQYAIKALDLLEENNTTEVKCTINSKAAAFCPTVISIGLLPALMVYSDKKDKEKNAILSVIWAIIKEDHNLHINGFEDILAYVSNCKTDDRHLMREHIMAAANAYKKALRTYPEEKTNANVDNTNGGEPT